MKKKHYTDIGIYKHPHKHECQVAKLQRIHVQLPKCPTYLHKLNPCLPAAKFPLCESWPLLLTLPNGFMKWNPVSLGAKYPQFQDLWVTWHMEKKLWFERLFWFFAIFFVRNWRSLQSLQNRWIGIWYIYIYICFTCCFTCDQLKKSCLHGCQGQDDCRWCCRRCGQRQVQVEQLSCSHRECYCSLDPRNLELRWKTTSRVAWSINLSCGLVDFV